MGPALTIRYRDVPVALNWTLVGLIAMTGLLAIGPLRLWFPDISLAGRIIGAISGVVLFFVSILIHELGHAWVARRHGVHVKGITLWLFGGLTEFRSRVPDAKAEFQIAVIGPLTNAVIGVALALTAVGLDRMNPKPAGGFLAGIIAGLAIMNLLVAAFNLIPAPPLDGGRILASVLWRRAGDADIAKLQAGRAGLVMWSGLVVVGIVMVSRELTGFDGWWTVGLGVFFALVARGEIFNAALSRRLRSTAAGGLMSHFPAPVHDSLTVADLLTWTGNEGANIAYPVTSWSSEPVGYVVPAVGGHLDAASQSWTKVSDVMVPAELAPRAWTDESLDSLLERLEPQTQLVVIHDVQTGQPVGTLSTAQIRPSLKQPDFWGRD